MNAKQKARDPKRQGLRRLVKRLEHARRTMQGLMLNAKAVRAELYARRPLGHRFWLAEGQQAEWVELPGRWIARHYRDAVPTVKVLKRHEANRQPKGGEKA